MAAKSVNSRNNHFEIGVVFTPTKWGKFAVEQFGIFEEWMAGSTVFDPTMGNGDLLEALIVTGLKKGYTLKQLPIKSLFGNELNDDFHAQAIQKFEEKYSVNMRANFTNKDILALPSRQYDILLGNPPWANFTDLPATYKEEIKEHFFTYDLAKSGPGLLLGGSRIDIAALVIQRALLDFLKHSGNAYFFMPLSLLLNDGANQQFRTYKIHDISFAPKQVFDFQSTQIFEGVATRYGLVHFKRDEAPSFPIPYELLENDTWNHRLARPLLEPTNPLSVLKPDEISPLDGFDFIELPKFSSPRQGINTCGANAVFFFTECQELDDTRCLVNGKIELPKKYVHPLLVGANFSQEILTAKKWVLLPYSDVGKVLTMEEIKGVPLLCKYLSNHREALISRKGSMIGSAIKRGIWWSLLGVGPYNFANSKIVWEAYGKSTFNPRILDGKWQVNQSLQAYIPFPTKKDAKKTYLAMSNPAIEAYLLSLKMEGTMNWAQPGKIKKLIRFVD
ncbi:MAG: hypothetical protein ACI837_001621 [Crocinitomicaceae bacterium]|jgi:hypothetical protein